MYQAIMFPINLKRKIVLNVDLKNLLTLEVRYAITTASIRAVRILCYICLKKPDSFASTQFCIANGLGA